MTAPTQPGLIGRVAGAVTGRVVDAVPPEVILDHLDLDAFLDRIDVNHLLDRIDIDRLMSRIDLNQLLATVDVNAMLTDVQLDELVRRAGIPALVAETTGQLATSTLGSIRAQLAGLDLLLTRLFDRVLRGRRGPRSDAGATPRARRVLAPAADPTGRYAGAASRTVAALLDYLLLLASSAAVLGVTDVLVQFVFDTSIRGAGGRVASLSLAAWTVLFFVGSLTVSGQTVGKAIVGLRVLRTDRRPPTFLNSLVRFLAFPISTSFLGLGLLMMLVHPRARALHDLVAGTIVVYDWGTQPTDITSPLQDYLRRHDADGPAPARVVDRA